MHQSTILGLFYDIQELRFRQRHAQTRFQLVLRTLAMLTRCPNHFNLYGQHERLIRREETSRQTTAEVNKSQLEEFEI